VPARLRQDSGLAITLGFSTMTNVEEGFDGFHRHPDPAFKGEARNMRGEDGIVQFLEGLLGSGGFLDKDIEAGPSRFSFP